MRTLVLKSEKYCAQTKDNTQINIFLINMVLFFFFTNVNISNLSLLGKENHFEHCTCTEIMHSPCLWGRWYVNIVQ